MSRDTYEVLLLAQGKRESSRLIAAGTPPPTNPQDSVLTDLRNLHRELGDDAWCSVPSALTTFSITPATCMHCAQLANPALGGDFLHADA